MYVWQGVYSTYYLELVGSFFLVCVWGGVVAFLYFFEKRKNEKCYEVPKSRKIIKGARRIKNKPFSHEFQEFLTPRHGRGQQSEH